MKHKIISLFSLAMVIIIFLSPLSIDVTLAQSQQLLIREMTNEAEAIVVGTVSAKRCEWTTDNSRIMTRVTIRVDEFVKGDQSGDEITVSHWGGEIGEVGELYSHTPRFAENEQVLLFVKKDKEENLRVCHGSEGKFRIQEDTTTKFKRVDNKSLDDLKAEIRAFIEIKKK